MQDYSVAVYVAWASGFDGISRSAQAGNIVLQLSDAERRKFRSLEMESARDQFAASRILAKALLERLGLGHGQRVEIANLCPNCLSADHGRPLVLLDGGPCAVALSISHTRDLVMVGVAERFYVGVDVEPIADLRELASSVLGSDEWKEWSATSELQRDRYLVQCWTQKEAALKALGLGLHEVDPQTIGTRRLSERSFAARVPQSTGVVATLHGARISTGDPLHAASVVFDKSEPLRIVGNIETGDHASRPRLSAK